MNVDRSIGLLKAMTVTVSACCMTALPALAQSTDLTTKSGNELGVTVSNYKYTEPGLMEIKATKIGFDYTGTYAFDSAWPNQSKGWFARANVRFATGKANYSSGTSGSLNNRPDRYHEIRAVIGKDFQFGDYTLSPYAGLGYRKLFNDLRGVTTTGAAGYRRESKYTTLPVGVTHRMNLANQAQLVTSAEYSFLLRGQQYSKFSDLVGFNGIIAAQDANNRQRSGYGLRLSMSYQVDQWAVGPYIDYWKIKQSDTVLVTRAVLGPVSLPVFEPANKTTEIGLKAVYRF